jgi:hypothetical protein
MGQARLVNKLVGGGSFLGLRTRTMGVLLARENIKWR